MGYKSARNNTQNNRQNPPRMQGHFLHPVEVSKLIRNVDRNVMIALKRTKLLKRFKCKHLKYDTVQAQNLLI